MSNEATDAGQGVLLFCEMCHNAYKPEDFDPESGLCLNCANKKASSASGVFAAHIGTAKIPNEGLVDYVRWHIVADKWDEREIETLTTIATLTAQVAALQQELETTIRIDKGTYDRLCTLQAIMSHPTATPTAEEFDEYCGLLELVFHTHEEGGDDDN